MNITKVKKNRFLLGLIIIGSCAGLAAQDPSAGVAALDEINQGVRQYYSPAKNLLFAVAALIALIGAVRVYQKWNNGDQDVNKAAMGWFGSAIFILAAALAITSLFGVS